MKNSEDGNSFLAQVDAIQRKFIESLITGQRDAIFRETGSAHKPESDHKQAQIDSQPGTL
jgi:hypothetical protein